MNVGLWGLDFGSDNLGCGALSYSFLQILDRYTVSSDKNVHVFVFTQEPCHIDLSFVHAVKRVEIIEYHLKDISTMRRLWHAVRMCSVIFDFTAGDSFADIYGMSRVVKSELMKSLVIISGTKLVLGPQTYGPFSKKLPRNWAKWILRHSHKVYARDQLSAEYVKHISGVDAECAVDVAFALPYEEANEASDVLRVGINVSGLLWNGGYTQNNQFELKTDYKQYCLELVRWLKEKNAEVHLVGHVLAESMPVEDDEKAARELNALCGEQCVIAPHFATPMEAKSYIAGMDVFIGARMHSTIAALSAERAVIPFAYSRKFRGVFETLKYPYLIEAAEMTTDQALKHTCDWIVNRKELKKKAEDANKRAENKLESFESSLRQQMSMLKEG